jgi:bifunctional non-homologous end joining protein LigD
MQCKPVRDLPSDEKRTFEIKFDGYRCIAVKRGREVTLFSRNQKVLNKRSQRWWRALTSLKGDFALDGELVVLDSQVRPSCYIIQYNLSQDVTIYFYVLDILNRNGELLVNLSLERRRELLDSMLSAVRDRSLCWL